MKQSQLEALLGRPLTSIEVSNLTLYLDIARRSLDDLLCMNLCDTSETKVYDAREGYSTVFTDIFTEVTEVKVNGDVIDTDKYSPRQWDRRTASWYNSIVFTYKLSQDDEVEVTAAWGFEKWPSDLQAVLANLFGLVTQKNQLDNSISSKQVEDFRISFNETDLDDEFYAKYRKTIAKYSLCGIDNIRQGEVWDGC